MPKVSINGGEPVEAESVVVIYEALEHDDYPDEPVEIHTKFTDEGVSYEVWAGAELNQDTSIVSQWELKHDLLERLMEDK